jgi:hypothetical protein
MNPNQFYFLILPLASLVFILIIIVLYYARKENNMQLKEMQMLNELMRTGVLDKANFSTALQDLVEEKIIDHDSFRRMGQLLEEHFDEPKDEAHQEIMETA